MVLTDPGPVSPGSDYQMPPKEGRECPPDEVGVDWLSVTFGDDTESTVHEWLRRHHDEPGMPSKPREGFRVARGWSTGVQLLSGHSSGRAWLSVPGSACRNLGSDAVHALGQVALMGGTCRRLDLRRDLRGRDLTLIGDLRTACNAGYLRLVKRAKSFDERDADGVTVLGDGMYLGSSSSLRFVRAYDKGLEQQTNPKGEWVRFELQLRDDLAHASAVKVFGAHPSVAQFIALDIIRGSVDFREGPRDDATNWRRYPRCPFWVRFTEGCGMRPSLPAADADAQRWADWWRMASAALVLACEQSGVPIKDAASALLADVRITEGTLRNPVVPKLAAFVADLTGVSKLSTVRHEQEEA